MKTVYRRFCAADFSELEKMVLALYKEDPGGEPIDSHKIKDTIEFLAKDADKGGTYIFERDGEIVGYAIVIKYWSNEHGFEVICLDELYVKPNARRQGAASGFIRDLVRCYPGQKIRVQVSSGNKQAVELYRTLGFIPSGYKSFELGSP